MKVSRILHAGYLFEYEGTRIAFDPVFENPFSVNCHAFPDVRFDLVAVRALKLDAVFISHHHDDHCSFASLDLLDRATPICMYCLHDEMFAWLRELGFRDVHALELDRPIVKGGLKVTPRRALDAETDSIFQIEAGGMKVLNVVDSWIDEETLELLASEAPWDLVLWPFQTMRELEVLTPSRAEPAAAGIPAEWKPQLIALKPKSLVPSSCQFRMEEWSWYNRAFFPQTYAGFAREMSALLPATCVTRMNPGETFALSSNGLTRAGRLEWIVPIGDQNVDYSHDPQARVPTTAEIARRFPALAPSEISRVEEYCRAGIAKRFAELGASPEPYFRKTRLWRLSVFDHRGEAALHFYSLGDDRLVPADPGIPEWTTEVPAFKLHAALTRGESLTPMYLRINDDLAGAEIVEADPLEDPLVRCLFEGVFGAYQHAQLEKILANQVQSH